MTQESLEGGVGRLLSDGLRHAVEQGVSAHLGRAWRVKRVEDKADEASHPAAILADETYAVFVKLGQGGLAWDQFKQEVAGLQLLTERSGVLTPEAIGVIQAGEEALLVREAVQVVKRERVHWRQMGQALARIHRVKGDRCGLAFHAYWGSLYQDNTPRCLSGDACSTVADQIKNAPANAPAAGGCQIEIEGVGQASQHAEDETYVNRVFNGSITHANSTQSFDVGYGNLNGRAGQLLQEAKGGP